MRFSIMPYYTDNMQEVVSIQPVTGSTEELTPLYEYMEEVEKKILELDAYEIVIALILSENDEIIGNSTLSALREYKNKFGELPLDINEANK